MPKIFVGYPAEKIGCRQFFYVYKQNKKVNMCKILFYRYLLFFNWNITVSNTRCKKIMIDLEQKEFVKDILTSKHK